MWENGKEEGIKAGIYQVLDYPFFVGATGFGFQYLFDNSVKLVKPFHINAFFKILSESESEPIGGGNICSCCFDTYTGKSRINNNYVNKKYGINRVITERGLIEKGINLY